MKEVEAEQSIQWKPEPVDEVLQQLLAEEEMLEQAERDQLAQQEQVPASPTLEDTAVNV